MGKHRITALAFAGLALLAASALGFGIVLASHIGFGTITTGFITKYHSEPPAATCLGTPSAKQDLSGAATDGEVIIFADDGGFLCAPLFNFVRVVTGGLPDNTAVNLPLAQVHKDMEGATFWPPYFVVTTSLEAGAGGAPKAAPFNRLTRFKVNNAKTALIEQESVNLRAQLMTALEAFGDANLGVAWFDRISSRLGKDGGLNIEGLSNGGRGSTARGNNSALNWGLRSPLFGPNFGVSSPPNLRDGLAIVARVNDPFGSTPSFEFKTLNLVTGLGNHGIRGMEWIPAMQRFVIIGGPVAASNDYSLWHWDGDTELVRLDVTGSPITVPFSKLCRPESVMQMEQDGKPFLVVFSEQSGAVCSPADPDPPPPHTFIKAEIGSGS